MGFQRFRELKRWKPTISHRGTKAARQVRTIAKCYARTTTEESQENKLNTYVIEKRVYCTNKLHPLISLLSKRPNTSNELLPTIFPKS